MSNSVFLTYNTLCWENTRLAKDKNLNHCSSHTSLHAGRKFSKKKREPEWKRKPEISKTNFTAVAKVHTRRVYPTPGFRRDTLYPLPGFRRDNLYPTPGFRRDNLYPTPGFRRDNLYPTPAFRRDTFYPLPGFRRDNLYPTPGSRRDNLYPTSGFRRDNLWQLWRLSGRDLISASAVPSTRGQKMALILIYGITQKGAVSSNLTFLNSDFEAVLKVWRRRTTKKSYEVFKPYLP